MNSPGLFSTYAHKALRRRRTRCAQRPAGPTCEATRAYLPSACQLATAYHHCMTCRIRPYSQPATLHYNAFQHLTWPDGRITLPACAADAMRDTTPRQTAPYSITADICPRHHWVTCLNGVRTTTRAPATPFTNNWLAVTFSGWPPQDGAAAHLTPRERGR